MPKSPSLSFCMQHLLRSWNPIKLWLRSSELRGCLKRVLNVLAFCPNFHVSSEDIQGHGCQVASCYLVHLCALFHISGKGTSHKTVSFTNLNEVADHWWKSQTDSRENSLGASGTPGISGVYLNRNAVISRPGMKLLILLLTPQG